MAYEAHPEYSFSKRDLDAASFLKAEVSPSGETQAAFRVILRLALPSLMLSEYSDV